VTQERIAENKGVFIEKREYKVFFSNFPPTANGKVFIFLAPFDLMLLTSHL
jgi:hypothetical protein